MSQGNDLAIAARLSNPVDLVLSGLLADYVEGALSSEDRALVELVLLTDTTSQAAYREILDCRAENIQAAKEGVKFEAKWVFGAVAAFACAIAAFSYWRDRPAPGKQVAVQTRPSIGSVLPPASPRELYPVPSLPDALIASLAQSVVGGEVVGLGKGLDATVTDIEPSQTVVSSERPTFEWKMPRWMVQAGGNFEVRLTVLGQREPSRVFVTYSESGQRATFRCPIALERGKTYEWCVVPLIDPTISLPRLPRGTVKAKFEVLSENARKGAALDHALSGQGAIPGEQLLGRKLARGIELAKAGLFLDALPSLREATHSADPKAAACAEAWLKKIALHGGKSH